LRGKDQKHTERARSLRRALTSAELRLWTGFRGRRLGGFKFARQEPIDRYAPTLPSPARGGGLGRGCRERRLVIELDGGQHAESPDDRQRDRTLCGLGYRVIRIWNNDVIENLDGFSNGSCPNSKNRPSPRPSPRIPGRTSGTAVRDPNHTQRRG
jgi:very-short-patch-repair endonuclease